MQLSSIQTSPRSSVDPRQPSAMVISPRLDAPSTGESGVLGAAISPAQVVLAGPAVAETLELEKFTGALGHLEFLNEATKKSLTERFSRYLEAPTSVVPISSKSQLFIEIIKTEMKELKIKDEEAIEKMHTLVENVDFTLKNGYEDYMVTGTIYLPDNYESLREASSVADLLRLLATPSDLFKNKVEIPAGAVVSLHDLKNGILSFSSKGGLKFLSNMDTFKLPATLDKNALEQIVCKLISGSADSSAISEQDAPLFNTILNALESVRDKNEDIASEFFFMIGKIQCMGQVDKAFLNRIITEFFHRDAGIIETKKKNSEAVKIEIDRAKPGQFMKRVFSPEFVGLEKGKIDQYNAEIRIANMKFSLELKAKWHPTFAEFLKQLPEKFMVSESCISFEVKSGPYALSLATRYDDAWAGQGDQPLTSGLHIVAARDKDTRKLSGKKNNSGLELGISPKTRENQGLLGKAMADLTETLKTDVASPAPVLA